MNHSFWKIQCRNRAITIFPDEEQRHRERLEGAWRSRVFVSGLLRSARNDDQMISS